nr:CmlA/FloR family chloramphenicol efflux MFS transporter [Burkholderia anthina]
MAGRARTAVARDDGRRPRDRCARTVSTIRDGNGAGNRGGGEKRRKAGNHGVSRQLAATARACRCRLSALVSKSPTLHASRKRASRGSDHGSGPVHGSLSRNDLLQPVVAAISPRHGRCRQIAAGKSFLSGCLVMPDQSAPAWAVSLPSALLLMVPFDVLASLAMDVYLPVIPDMPAALHASPATVQLTLSVYMVILGLGQMVFGPWSDRVGRRPVLLGGALLFSATSLALAMTNSGAGFVALRALQAAGASAALVATFATVRDVYADRPEGATIYSQFGAILAFVPALGPMLGAGIARASGWRAIFVILGVAGCVAAGRAWSQWHETRPRTQRRASHAVASILRNPSFLVYAFGFGTAMGAFFVFFSIAPRVLIDGAGLSRPAFSAAFASVALVMIVAARVVRRCVSTWGVAGCFVRGAVVMMIGAIVLAACTRLMAPSFVAFVMPMWIVAVGIVLMSSVSANGALRDFDDVAGTAVALYYCVQSLIVGGVGTLAVLVLSGDTPWPLAAFCFCMPAACCCAIAALKRRGG